MTEEPAVAYGMKAARDVMRGGGGWPRVKIEHLERTRFHALTTGEDPNFLAVSFHVFGVFPNSRTVVCLRSLTSGQEACQYCSEGHTPSERRFLLWAWVYDIIHTRDNPDPEGASWKQVKVGDRTLFQETIGKALLIDLKGGQGGRWFRQFLNEYLNEGTLQKYLYELRREGEGLQTEYYLGRVKEDPVPSSLMEDEKVKSLPTMSDIVRGGLQFGPASAAAGGAESVLGADSLQQAPAEAAIEELPVAQPVMSGNADELI